jgi:hypothetical protein
LENGRVSSSPFSALTPFFSLTFFQLLLKVIPLLVACDVQNDVRYFLQRLFQTQEWFTCTQLQFEDMHDAVQALIERREDFVSQMLSKLMS